MREALVKYTQDEHCCMATDAGEVHLTLELMDGGGGEFLVVHANHWSLETDEEVDMLAAQMKAMLAKAKTR